LSRRKKQGLVVHTAEAHRALLSRLDADLTELVLKRFTNFVDEIDIVQVRWVFVGHPTETCRRVFDSTALVRGAIEKPARSRGLRHWRKRRFRFTT
jgi:hypothetical protein